MSTPFKIMKTGPEARAELIKGADYLGDAVRSTLGPFGQNFAFEKKNRITNDGVTVAREVELRDEIQNRGVSILREAAIKTNDEVGDGTTTAITLAQAILKETVKLIGTGIASKKTPVEIRQQIEKERLEVTDKLTALAKPVETEEELINSATVSVEDADLGKLIGSAQWKLGKEGFLVADMTNDRECSVEYVNGVRIDNGFGASAMINNLEKQSLEVSGAKTILTNYVFGEDVGEEPLKPILTALYKTGVRDVIVFGRAFSIRALREFKAEYDAGLHIYPINAPYEDQAEVMKDLQAVLGGKFFNTEEVDVKDMNLSDIGYSKTLTAKRTSAIITGEQDIHAGTRVSLRVTELEKQLKGSQSEFEKKNLQRRIALLTTGMGIIKIGALSEAERGYKLDKAEDAVNAVRMAFQEGVVPGAGLAFKTISDGLPEGYILKKPLLSIYEQIMSTAPANFEIPAWVQDPVKVLRVALEKACSVAGVFATAGGANATEREKPRYVQEAITPKAE